MTDPMNPDLSRDSPPTRTELVWPGKRTQVERVALPFQVVETVNQSRASREQSPLLGLIPPPLFEVPPQAGEPNKLIWGDNAYVMASLLQGDPSIGLEPLAGKIDLIYIDPPFGTGQDFSYRVRVGDPSTGSGQAEWVKEASVIEEKAYRDTWGRGLESYLQMMYERLVLMRELLAGDGSIYVHVGHQVSHHLKVIMDEILGPERLLNDIVWQRTGAHNDPERYGNVAESLLFYSKGDSYAWNPQYTEYTDEYIQERFRSVEPDTERRYWLNTATAPGHGRTATARRFSGKLLDPPAGTHWRFSQEKIDQLEQEGRIVVLNTGMPYVKQYLDEMPGRPLQNVWTDIRMTKSGYERVGFDTQKPEALLERVIATSSNKGGLVADFFCGSGTTMAVAEKLGRRWIGCDLSRYAIQVTRKRLLDIPGCKPFQVLNLGKYERQHWQVNVLNGHQGSPEQAASDYIRFVVSLYHADPSTGSGGYRHLHGQKAGRWMHVGATDAPVTRAEVMDAIRECQAHRYTALDVLGWEWEMGLHETIREEAKRMAVDLRLLVIPREVMDKRAVQAGDVPFYELAYLKTSLHQDGRTVTVKLEDFIIPNPDLVPDEVRSKVKKWSDYIDFWAVDWSYQGDTFHNEWQTYRTRKEPVLRLLSDPHPYPAPGVHRILVKVIDIFGNDTTQLLEATGP